MDKGKLINATVFFAFPNLKQFELKLTTDTVCHEGETNTVQQLYKVC